MALPGENLSQKWPCQGKILAKNGPARGKFKPKRALYSKNEIYFFFQKAIFRG